ncbi:hypothetical protein D1AOALGA4SA_7167 [Olavius algarvensis Delta 1 endosymbiont]|nr:hypothetical protein D1AOALGA4SA_7167 [Olavius algarvensis Delta 1 endosymbiont]
MWNLFFISLIYPICEKIVFISLIFSCFVEKHTSIREFKKLKIKY